MSIPDGGVSRLDHVDDGGHLGVVLSDWRPYNRDHGDRCIDLRAGQELVEAGADSASSRCMVAVPVDPIEAGRIMEVAIEQDPGLRKKVFKHAKVALSDPEGISKVVATNPLMSFQTSESVDQ